MTTTATQLETWAAVAIGTDGSITLETYATLNGVDWGLIGWSWQADPWADTGSTWDAAIVGEDEYDECRAQAWYASWEAAIAANLKDFESPEEGLAARLEKGADWRSYFEENFYEAGRSAPNGRPYFRLKP